MEAKPKIFLSYTRSDLEAVERLYARLSDAGYEPWMDTHGILPGEDWRLSIERAVRAADFFLACLSPRSVDRRGFLQRELKQALDLWQEQLADDIYLIPVRLEECEMPDSLRRFQRVDLFEPDGWSRLVQALRTGTRRRAETASPAAAMQESPPVGPDMQPESRPGPKKEAASPSSRRLSLRSRGGPPAVARPPSVGEPGSFTDFFLAPPRGWTGISVWLGGGLIGNLLAALITFLVGTSFWLLVPWVVAIAFILLGIYLVRQQAEPRILVPEDDLPAKYRGLIVLVGTGRPGENPKDQSTWATIQYHMATGQEVGLETCWLIASEGANGSQAVAQDYQKMCHDNQVTAYVRTVGVPFDVQESYDLVMHIYDEEVPKAGLTEQDVIADFTGGVKPMSAGMILACGDRRPMEYMYGRKKDVASAPRLVRFAPRRPKRR